LKAAVNRIFQPAGGEISSPPAFCFNARRGYNRGLQADLDFQPASFPDLELMFAIYIFPV
jgi:hypothetical protein